MSAEPLARGVALTVGALVAFAANSILCRLALGGGAIDPVSFTVARLAAGALVLGAVARSRQVELRRQAPHWTGALWLVLYALPFSVAYLWLDTGTGALLLFGAVQLTLVAAAVRAGERPSLVESLGLLGAGAGLVYLVLPGLSAPDPFGASLMVTAGIGWGLYTVAGKRGGDPVVTTATHFRRGAVLVLPAIAVGYATLRISVEGLALAIGSGAIASGLGYVTWYAALRFLTATRAALVQLAVPILAAAGGVLFRGEPVTSRLLVASAVILGSLALAFGVRRRR